MDGYAQAERNLKILIYDMLRQDYKIDLRKIKGHDGETSRRVSH